MAVESRSEGTEVLVCGLPSSKTRLHWRVFVNTVMNLPVTQKMSNFLSSQTTASFSRKVLFHDVTADSCEHGKELSGPIKG
jgi:hypothetical protein